jgi:hypothetical protein
MSSTTRLTFSNITPARVFSSTGNDIYYTGNVGIGKSNPAVALDVSGNMTITGNTTICGSLVTSDSVSLNLGNTNAVYSFGSNALVIDTFTNRVGIGKTNPSVLLDISGNTTICGTLYVSNINGNDLGTGSIATQWTTSNSNIFYRTGNVGIGKSNPTVVLDVSGSSAVSGNVAIGKSSASSSLDVSGNAVVSGNLTVDSTTLVVDASNNRVGIGLANPSVALDVNGTVMYSGGIIKTQFFSGLRGSFGSLNTDALRFNTSSSTSMQDATSILFIPINTINRPSIISCMCSYRWFSSGTTNSTTTGGAGSDEFYITLRDGANNELDVITPRFISDVGGGGRQPTKTLVGYIDLPAGTSSSMVFKLSHRRSSPADDNSTIDLRYTTFLVHQIVE